MPENTIKKQIAEKALTFIKPGMLIGLGTGSTASAFIELLSKQKLAIQTVATSTASETLARRLGLQVTDINSISHIDITFDGADEIDKQKHLIKGAGGALLREKILAEASTELVILIEASKQSPNLGRVKLPVEIVPFGHLLTASTIERLGYKGKFRKLSTNHLYITDNGNYIFDIEFSKPCTNPEEDEKKLTAIAGVITTGFFLNITGRVVVGYPDGRIELIK